MVEDNYKLQPISRRNVRNLDQKDDDGFENGKSGSNNLVY